MPDSAVIVARPTPGINNLIHFTLRPNAKTG